MVRFYFFAVLFSLLFLLSCKKEEAILGVDTPPRYFYLVTSDKPNALKLLEFPSLKIVEENIYLAKNNIPLNEISQIAEFRGYVYIFQRNAKKITIATSDSLKYVGELEWQSLKCEPASIAFVNATTAFISFFDTALVNVLDLTNFKLARVINTSDTISYLDNASNLVVGLSSSSGNLVVIDSRTFSVVKSLKVGDKPLGFAFDTERNLLYVLCQGKGKNDTLNPKTNAKLVIIAFPDFVVTSQIDLAIGSISAENLVPTNIAVSGRFFGFISTLSGLLRFSLSNPSQIQRFITGEFYNITYDYKRDQLIALAKSGNSSIIYILNPNNAAVVNKFTLNKDILLIFPI